MSIPADMEQPMACASAFYNEWEGNFLGKGQLLDKSKMNLFLPVPAESPECRQTWTLLQVNNYSCICHKYLAEGNIAKIEIRPPSNCQMARIIQRT